MSFAGFWLSFIDFAREANDSVLGYRVGRGGDMLIVFFEFVWKLVGNLLIMCSDRV